MRRLALAGALAAGALLVPNAQAGTPQVTDPANDANFTGREASVGNQAYADVLSIEWKSVTKTVKKKKTVTAFQVVTTLSAPPVAPAGTSLVYRMLGKTPLCGFFGVVYYTHQHSDKTIPQSAVRDNCINETTRLTPIALPVIKGNTMTWTVPISAIPKDTKVRPGSTLTDLFFQVNEIQDFRGVCLPDLSAVPDDPIGVTGVVKAYSKACGLGAGQVDGGTSTAKYKI